MTWDYRDEQRLNTLRNEIDALERRRNDAADAVRKLADELQAAMVGAHIPTAWFIDNADAIRDALAPFDSGVRKGNIR